MIMRVFFSSFVILIKVRIITLSSNVELIFSFFSRTPFSLSPLTPPPSPVLSTPHLGILICSLSPSNSLPSASLSCALAISIFACLALWLLAFLASNIALCLALTVDLRLGAFSPRDPEALG